MLGIHTVVGAPLELLRDDCSIYNTGINDFSTHAALMPISCPLSPMYMYGASEVFCEAGSRNSPTLSRSATWRPCLVSSSTMTTNAIKWDTNRMNTQMSVCSLNLRIVRCACYHCITQYNTGLSTAGSDAQHVAVVMQGKRCKLGYESCCLFMHGTVGMLPHVNAGFLKSISDHHLDEMYASQM